MIQQNKAGVLFCNREYQMESVMTVMFYFWPMSFKGEKLQKWQVIVSLTIS